MKKAVVLLSGGIDSSTTLAIAKSGGVGIYALSFDYNQRHRVELEAAKKVAESFNVKKHLVIKFDLREIGGSALTSEMEVPASRGHEVLEAEELNLGPPSRAGAPGTAPEINLTPLLNIPVTYVPARNTIFLSFALAWAEVLEAPDIFIGANVMDYSGYPDCRPEYLMAFEEAANLATKASVEGRVRFRINAPLINLRKAEIIKRGLGLGLDYGLTWSCYDPQPGPIDGSANPCLRCDSCRIRAKGFGEAGVKDPLLL